MRKRRDLVLDRRRENGDPSSPLVSCVGRSLSVAGDHRRGFWPLHGRQRGERDSTGLRRWRFRFESSIERSRLDPKIVSGAEGSEIAGAACDLAGALLRAQRARQARGVQR